MVLNMTVTKMRETARATGVGFTPVLDCATLTMMLSRCMFRLLLLLAIALGAQAQESPPPPDSAPQAPEAHDTFFEHSQTSKWWVSGQANFIFQANGDFYAQYSGKNSFKNKSDTALSRVLTLY